MTTFKLGDIVRIKPSNHIITGLKTPDYSGNPYQVFWPIVEAGGLVGVVVESKALNMANADGTITVENNGSFYIVQSWQVEKLENI